MRALLDPRLRPALDDFVPSRCTIQNVNLTATASGQELPGTPTGIVGRINLACRIGPLILIRPTDNEIRTQRVQSEYHSRQLKLDGYYPDIVPRLMQAVVDGVTYPIRGVEHDGSRFSTRLRLEVIKP